MPARYPWPILAVFAFACCLPGVFLVVYQQRFGFHPMIVVFGQGLVLLVIALLGLVALAFSGHARSRFFGISVALAAGVLVAVFAGAFVSNAVWGDTLNYEIARTFAWHSGALVDFLPTVPSRKKLILAGVLISGGLCLLLTLVVAMVISVRLAARVDHWLSDPASRKRRFRGLASALGGTAVLSAGVCAVIVLMSPRSLYGEPISGFFKFIPVTSFLRFDSARFAAAIEDRSVRASYRAPASFERKHVIVIFADALRADRMGVYGYHRPNTPFLSDLYTKKRLHRVEMALSTCSESFCGVASTLASRPFHQISQYNFKLHSLLRDAGYRINFFLTGDHRSWNYLFDFYGADVDAIHDYRSLGLKEIHDDRAILDALDTVDAAGAQPNFFYFFLMSSHINGRRQPEYERYQPVTTDTMRVLTFWNELAGTQRLEGAGVRQRGIDGQEIEAISNRYDNGVLQTDAYLRRIFATLDAKGYLQNSIVVILGDHGDGLGEHGHIGHTRYLFQEDIRIPLLVYDGGIERYRNDAFAAQIDVAPTILERLGLPIPGGWQGESLLKPPSERMTLHQTRRERAPCFAMVERMSASLMKYIRCGDAGQRTYEALFDLRADPGEQNNLTGSAVPERIARYRREIDNRFDIVVCGGSECQD